MRQLERHHQASSETAHTRCAARSIGDERPCTRCGIGSPVLLMSRPSLMKARRSSIESSVHEASSNELQPARVARSRHLMRSAIRRNQMQSRRNPDAIQMQSRRNPDAIKGHRWHVLGPSLELRIEPLARAVESALERLLRARYLWGKRGPRRGEHSHAGCTAGDRSAAVSTCMLGCTVGGAYCEGGR